ncbi:MAG: sensor domain-containing diguanylate cyclase [Candidatus Omnitrophota bacterium]|nr:sensor domain-containing diguanylate cyclase [Candidatus Omnitrophota bacterium]
MLPAAVLKIILRIILSLFLFIVIPILIAFNFSSYPLKLLFIFYLSNAGVLCLLLNQNSKARYQIESKIQDIREKLNIVRADTLKEQKFNEALLAKRERYDNLKKIVEEISQNLDLEYISNSITEIIFSSISNHKGTCLLYLIDKQTQRLSLFKAKKEEEDLVIKTKEGDIFDMWMLRHVTPLLVSDIKKDFRFDSEKLKAQSTMLVSSLISAPLVSENNFLGILRLDNPNPDFYTQDDLRFLVSVSNLGAVAIEGSQLFLKTQELAIRDSLTLVYTKGYLMERLALECERGIRKGAVFSLLMLDIDFFKNYNDEFGHSAGDIVLKRLTENIVNSLKDLNPLVCRFGGEEFCIILEGRDKVSALEIAERLCKIIEKDKIILRRQETSVTVSIGVVAFPGDGLRPDELIAKVDKAMYEAKRKGRNQVCGI